MSGARAFSAARVEARPVTTDLSLPGRKPRLNNAAWTGPGEVLCKVSVGIEDEPDVRMGLLQGLKTRAGCLQRDFLYVEGIQEALTDQPGKKQRVIAVAGCGVEQHRADPVRQSSDSAADGRVGQFVKPEQSGGLRGGHQRTSGTEA